MTLTAPSGQPAIYVVRNIFQYKPIPKPPLHIAPRTREQITQSPMTPEWEDALSVEENQPS